MSANNLKLNSITQKKSNNVSFSSYNFKEQSNNSLNKNNNNYNNKTKTVEDHTNLNLSLHKNNSCLFLKKINLNEKNNRYYNKALENLYYNPNNFFDEKYEEKEVIFGKKDRNNKGIKEIYEYYSRIKKRKQGMNKNDIKSLSVSEKSLTKSRSNNLLNKQKSFLDETITNKTLIPINSRKETKNYPISDNELKLIYKDFTEREEKNKTLNLKLKSPKKLLNTSQKININNILDLQEKILNEKNDENKINEININKIIKNTLKDRNRILMNQQKNLLIIKGRTLNKELIKFNSNNPSFNDIMKNWIYGFRKNKNEEKKSKINSPKEIICNNKDNENNENNASQNIRKLILQKNEIYEKKDNINYNKNSNLSSFHNLYIQGKNLLKQEIKLSKDLIGKKKKMYRYYFTPDEVSNILVAKSYSVEKKYSPIAVINSMEVHKS